MWRLREELGEDSRRDHNFETTFYINLTSVSWVLKPVPLQILFPVRVSFCDSHPAQSKPLSVMVWTVLMMVESAIPSLDSNSCLHKRERPTGGDASSPAQFYLSADSLSVQCLLPWCRADPSELYHFHYQRKMEHWVAVITEQIRSGRFSVSVYLS